MPLFVVLSDLEYFAYELQTMSRFIAYYQAF